MTPAGTITLTCFAGGEYKIRVQAVTDKKTSDDYLMADLFCQNAPIPNFPPKFITPLSDQIISVNLINLKNEIDQYYYLPAVMDINPSDNVTTTLDYTLIFMYYDKENKRIVFEKSKITEDLIWTKFEAKITLRDTQDATTSYSFWVKISETVDFAIE